MRRPDPSSRKDAAKAGRDAVAAATVGKKSGRLWLEQNAKPESEVASGLDRCGGFFVGPLEEGSRAFG